MTPQMKSLRAAALGDLARDVRRKTLQLLDWAEPGELLWAPPGTANHVLWHAGHAVWAHDALGVQRITGHSELPPGWAGLFGMGSRPSRQGGWPDKGEVRRQLERQLPRLLELLATVTDAQLAAVPRAYVGRDDRTLEECVGHAVHDEANHQGEMYLLLKMQRLRPGRG